MSRRVVAERRVTLAGLAGQTFVATVEKTPRGRLVARCAVEVVRPGDGALCQTDTLELPLSSLGAVAQAIAELGGVGAGRAA